MLRAHRQHGRQHPADHAAGNHAARPPARFWNGRARATHTRVFHWRRSSRVPRPRGRGTTKATWGLCRATRLTRTPPTTLSPRHRAAPSFSSGTSACHHPTPTPHTVHLHLHPHPTPPHHTMPCAVPSPHTHTNTVYLHLHSHPHLHHRTAPHHTTLCAVPCHVGNARARPDPNPRAHLVTLCACVCVCVAFPHQPDQVCTARDPCTALAQAHQLTSPFG